MISLFSIAIGCLILIPTIPLVLYCIGLVLPSSHIVSRSTIYHNTTADLLWAILTSVKDYPAWRSNIAFVTVDADDAENGDLDDLNKYQDRMSFVEYSKKKNRKTNVTHVELAPNKKLLRVLQETPELNAQGELYKTKPTFSGSWTFEIKAVEEGGVELKITEQGEINKPMVRVSHRLFFGYYRRIDRFMKDLGKEVEFAAQATPMDEALAEEEEEEEEEGLAAVKEEEEEESDHEAGPDESLIDTSSGNEAKDWDMMSEMYDRPHAVN
ncbi:hypothetical protein K501DRAFT_251365 [Backusella circina FSU 941]|nr:hypothetical protein K501DRAFT_251365 [Backusella circina FSU 941]